LTTLQPTRYLYPPRQRLRILYKSSTKKAFFCNHLHYMCTANSHLPVYIYSYNLGCVVCCTLFLHLFLCVTDTPKPRLFTGLKNNLFNQSTCFSRPKSCSSLNKITALNPLFRWLAATLTHSYITFVRRHSLRFLSISSSLVSSVGKASLGSRAENRTRAFLTTSRRTTN
jgi:hypothetical protein